MKIITLAYFIYFITVFAIAGTWDYEEQQKHVQQHERNFIQETTK